VNPLILIVEDHDVLRASLCDWLGDTFPACRFLEARSGEEAVVLAGAAPPAIVLMDIGLPQMNGIAATRHIKAAAPHAQVVMLTNYEADDYQADARAAGASAYVLKWKMQAELIPLLARWLGNLLDPDGGSR